MAELQISENQGEDTGDYQLSLPGESGARYGEYNPKDARSKADRVKFSMDKEDARFFDPNAVENTLLVDSEQGLADALATSQAVKRDRRKLELFQSIAYNKEKAGGGPVTPMERDIIMGLTEPEMKDPGTVLERKFAESLTNLALEKKRTMWEGAASEDDNSAHDTADGFEGYATKSEIARTVAEKARKRTEDQSWAPYIADQAKTIMVPLYDTVKTHNLLKDAPTNSYLKGNNIAEQVQYLWSINDPNQFKKELTDAYESLAKDNVPLAEEWINAMIGYTTQSASLDNLFTVIDTPDAAGTAFGAAKLGIKIAKVGPKASVSALKKLTRDLAAVTSKRNLSTEDILTTAGETIDAATIKAANATKLSESLGASGKAGVEEVSALITKTSPALNDPAAVLDVGVPTRITNQFAVRLMEQMNIATRAMGRILGDVNLVARLDQDTRALDQAFDNAIERVKDFYGPSVRNAVIDAQTRRIYGTDTFSNVSRVEVAIGKTSGDLFTNAENAKLVIRDYYGIPEDTFRIEQLGDKFYGVVRKDIDETQVKDLLIEPRTSTRINPFGYILNKVRSADAVVSEANKSARKTATYSAEELKRLYSMITKPIADLSKRERGKVSRVLEENRDIPHPKTGERGYYYKTVNEFDEAYIRLHKSLPSPEERIAYFAAIQANDFDYILRNLNLYRNRASQGWEEASFHISGNSTPHLAVKSFGDIPWDEAEDARILLIDKDGQPKIVYKNQMPDDEKSLLKEQIKNKGRRVTLITQPMRREIEAFIPEELRGSDPINFVVSAKPKIRPLSSVQIPYREGGHVVNDYKFFVKNANVISSHVGKAYGGDLTYSGHTTEREAQQFAAVLERGRGLFNAEKLNKADKKILDDFVNTNLPMSPNEFRQQFHKGILNSNGPIVVLRDGVRYSDIHDLKSQNLRDLTKSVYNYEDNLDKAFTGEKGEALYTFHKASPGNPSWKMEVGSTLNPIDSLNQGLREALKSRLYNDYIMRSANEFTEQFGDLMTTSQDVMRRNPIYWLYHPQWKDAGKVYTSPGIESRVIETTKTVPSRPRKTTYPLLEGKTNEWEDGSLIRGGQDNGLLDPDKFDRDYANVQDAFGPRRAGDSTLKVPEWFKDAEELAKELAAKLDLPNIKLWFGEAVGDTKGVWSADKTVVDDFVSTVVLSHSLSRSEAIRILTHEIGHAVDYSALRAAPAAVQDAIQKAYTNWYLKIMQNSSTTSVQVLRAGGISAENSTNTISEQMMKNPSWTTYALSQNEWFAEETSRWLLTRKKPMNVVERFFEDLAQKWKTLFETVWPGKKEVPVNKAVASFLLGQWREDKNITTRTLQTFTNFPAGSDNSLARMSAAKAMRDAVISLVETPTPVRVAWDAVRNRILNFTYDKWGADAAQWLDDSALLKTRDPIKFARSIAFHSKIGLFNPVQFFLNTMTLFHSAAISPTHAPGAFKDALTLFYTRRNPSTEVANWMKKKTGYRYYDELYSELNRSGFANVGGSTADLDNFLEPKVVQSKFGKFLDVGTVFFRSAEELVRINAFSIAHREFRKADPTKVIDDATRRKLIQRADDLSVNMSRASTAWYNRGFGSIPAQFTSYNMRLSEQLLEGAFSGRGALSRAETARVMGAYSLLFGVPTAGAAMVGIWPLQQSFEEAATSYGVDLDANLAAKTLSRGLLNTIMDVGLNTDTNFSERYGPNGLSLLRDIVNGDKTMVDFLVGASGSVVGKTLMATYPLAVALGNALSDDPEVPLVYNDLLDAARNISTIDNATKAYMAYNWGLYITKNEVQMADVDGIVGLNLSLLGLTPREVSDAYIGKRVIADLAKHQTEITNMAVKEFHRAFRAIQEGNDKEGDKYFKRAQAFIAGSNLSLLQKNEVFSRALSEYGNEVDDVNQKLLMKSQTQEIFNRRMERINRLEQKKGN